MITPTKLQTYLDYLMERVYVDTESLYYVSEGYKVAIAAVMRWRASGVYAPLDATERELEYPRWDAAQHGPA